jgi:hypothetical protein
VADPFRSSRLKIDRAKHHIDEIDARLIRFETEDPYVVVIEEDAEPGYEVHKLRLRERSPCDAISVMVGDAINNLRAALDHAVCACAIATGNSAPKFRTCSFPFGKDLATFNSAVMGCTSVPEEIRTCLRSFQAYETGYRALWTLNQMCNWDKHALIRATIIGFGDDRILLRSGTIEPPKNPFWDNPKEEVELFRTNSNPQYDLRFTLEIAFDGPGLLAGKRIVPALNAFLDPVERVLMALEAETRRLFP